MRVRGDGVNQEGSGPGGPPRLVALLATGLALAAGGCGDGSGGADGAGGPGSEPRLEGRYLVTLNPRDYDRDAQRVRWQVTPLCESGPCDARVKTSGADRIDLRFDAKSGRYTGRVTYEADCVSRRTGRLLVADAYRDRARLTLEPLETEETDDGNVVTAFRGRSRRTLSVSRSARERFRCTIGREERVETDGVKGDRVE